MIRADLLDVDPLSILVPFLIFSIGCSHAVQMTKAWKDAIAEGFDATDASRSAFSQLFIPGTLALVTNALGFLVIMLIEIDIDIVRELGITATLGVSLMIVTNKMVLPILLTYLQIDQMTLDAKQTQEKASSRSGAPARISPSGARPSGRRSIRPGHHASARSRIIRVRHEPATCQTRRDRPAVAGPAARGDRRGWLCLRRRRGDAGRLAGRRFADRLGCVLRQLE